MERVEGASQRNLRRQFLVCASVFLGLFFVEYPPLFLIGYWSWGPVVHKVLSGVFLVLNLAVALYAQRRVGVYRRVSNADDRSARASPEV